MQVQVLVPVQQVRQQQVREPVLVREQVLVRLRALEQL